jgi:hypothetical protein
VTREIANGFRVISFGSEGQPHDTGKDLTAAMLKFTNLARSYGFASDVYYPRNFTNGADAWAVKDYPSECWPKNPTYCHVNFGAWKAVMLERALKKANAGDVILYSDGDPGRSSHPEDMSGWKTASAWALSRAKADIVIAWEENLKMRGWVNAKVVRELGSAFPEDDYYDWGLLNAAHILVRKSPQSEQFVQEAKKAMRDHHDWMTSPGSHYQPQKGFQWSTGDQNVWNVVLRKAVLNGKLPASWPGFSARNHRWNINVFRSSRAELARR